MESRSHAFVAGLFVLGLGTAVILVALWMGRMSQVPTVPYLLVSRTSVGGLTIQAPVRYRGVEVGQVEHVGFDPRDRRTILIRIEIEAQTPVTDATFGRLTFQGVTGIPFVEIDDEGKLGRPLSTSWRDPARIELRPSTLQEFGDAGQLLLVRVNDIAERLNVLLSKENQEHLQGMLAGLNVLIERLVRLQEQLEPTVERLPALVDGGTATLDEMRDLSRELAGLTRSLQDRAGAVDQVGRGVEQMGMAASDLTTQTLPRLNRVLLRLERTTESLERVLEAQARDPRGLLFGTAPPEPGPGEPGFEPGAGGDR